MNKNRKDFTIVELVIVIAIIAILAAVLIPTFASLIQKANISKDTQVIRNLNTAIATATEKPETMRDALKIAAEAGYLVDKINAAANGNDILWDSENKVFCYYNAATKAVAYIPETKIETTNAPEYKFWKIYNDKMPALSEQRYSIYLTANATADEEVTVKVGFDAGDNTKVKTVNYKNEGNEGAGQKVDIFTNGGNLIVNAKNDTVSHFGEADKVNVVAVADHSYYENGVASVLLITKGRVVIAKDAKIDMLIVEADDTNNVKLAVESGATIVSAKIPDGVEGKDSVVASDVTVVEVKDVTALNNAVANPTNNVYVKLGADIDASSTSVTIANNGGEYDITIDGNGYTLTSKNNRVIQTCQKNNTNYTGMLTINNLNIVCAIKETNGENKNTRGISLWRFEGTLNFSRSKITMTAGCDNYGINWGPKSSNGVLNIKDSEISAYQCVNIYGGNRTVSIENCKLNAVNEHNSYTGACVTVFEDSSATVSINNCTMTTKSAADKAPEYGVTFGSAKGQTIYANVTIENCSLNGETFSVENKNAFGYIDNNMANGSITIDGIRVVSK